MQDVAQEGLDGISEADPRCEELDGSSVEMRPAKLGLIQIHLSSHLVHGNLHPGLRAGPRVVLLRGESAGLFLGDSAGFCLGSKRANLDYGCNLGFSK